MVKCILPLVTKFTLGLKITPEQSAFLDEHGFLHFRSVATKEEAAMILDEARRISERWIAEGKKSVFGIPLF